MIEDEFDLWPVGSLPDGWQRLATRVGEWLDRVQPPEEVMLIGTALLVGLGTGLGTVVFIWLIERFGQLFARIGVLLSGVNPYAIILIPALGGLVAGPLIFSFAREAKGHGVPEVMEAIVLRGGRIRPAVVVVKALASAACIGSGGSAGREGPIVQIGSALGSVIGQFFRLSDARIRNLVACGAAAGIAATFNAPIAGAIFALEVILGEFTTAYFGTVVISAVAAGVVSRSFLGESPAFLVPTYTMVSAWEMLFYTVLGVLAAFVAWLFVAVLYWLEDIFDGWRFLDHLKPFIGGLPVGLIGFYLPQTLGTGFPSIEHVLRGDQLVVGLLLLLILGKVATTGFTLGSGNSGGVFAPALFMGAMLGGAFGTVIHGWMPAITATSGAYALVGMAAVFAAAAHAPITGVLIVFEMSGDYRLILPLMLATVIAALFSEWLRRDSIYTLKLSRRGIHLERGHDIDVMQGVLVGEAMSTDVATISPDVNLVDLEIAFLESHHHGFVVIDEDNELFGVVTLQDLERAKRQEGWQNMRVRDIATTSVLTAYPDEPVWVALKRLSTRDVGRLPVVSRDDEHKVLGVVRRSDIIRAYRRAILRRMEMQGRTERLRLGKLSGAEFVEVEISESCPVVGKTVQQLPLPRGCLLVSIRREGKMMIVHGDTALQVGDRVTALVDTKCRDAFEDVFYE